MTKACFGLLGWMVIAGAARAENLKYHECEVRQRAAREAKEAQDQRVQEALRKHTFHRREREAFEQLIQEAEKLLRELALRERGV